MISSLQSYTFYAQDKPETLRRVSAQPVIARELQYYRDTIGSIRSVDEFLANDRIYNYAIKAYGLEEMGYAKAFIRKVLESDLTDPNSFANRLQDTKYRALAAAYDFGNTVSTKAVQTSSQIDNLVGTYERNVENRDLVLREDIGYYGRMIGSIANVDDIFKNSRMRDIVFTAFDIDPKTFDYSTIKNVITSDISDPSSFVNTEFVPKLDQWNGQILDLSVQRQTPGLTKAELDKIDYLIAQYSKSIDKVSSYFDLAASFNFNPDGTPMSGVDVQSEAQQTLLKERYAVSQPRLTYTGALLDKDYYESRIASITSVDDLLADRRLSIMVLTAFGIPLTTSRNDVASALTQDASDPDSPLHQRLRVFTELSNAFNFESDGSLAPGAAPQDETQLNQTMGLYLTRYGEADDAKDAETIRQYRRYIGLTRNLDDFLSGAGAAVIVRNFALQAHNISPSEVSTFKLKQIFTSDPYDPNSYLNRLKDDRFVQLAKAYNFAADGSIGSPRFAQTENEITRISKAYYVEMTRFDASQSAKDKANDEVEYYRSKLQTLETVEQLVSDTRLTNFLLISEGLSPDDVTPETLRKILTSDLSDPESFANTQDDIRFQKIAGSYSFNDKGFIEPKASPSVQSNRGLVETENLFLTQSLEQEAGEGNIGARLALYFERMAPSIRNIYEILADNALAEFVRTAFSIPAETSGSDIDRQAALIEKQLDIKDLQDPEKLRAMITRFLALQDVENSGPDPIIAAFSGGTSISFETVAALTQLRSGYRR